MKALKDQLSEKWVAVRLEPDDFPMIRSFILRLCSELVNPDFFITSDIDSELPALLQRGGGLVYGAVAGGSLVATQAIVFDSGLDAQIVGMMSGVDFSRPVESSWTMVAASYRRLGIAQKLAVRLEIDAYREFDCD